MAFKYPWEKEEKKEEITTELPKELEDKFTSVKTDVTTEVNKKIDERFASLDPVIDYVKSQQKRQADADAAEEARKNKKHEEDTTVSDEDLAAQLLTNPRAVLAEANKSTNNLVLMIRADNIKREVFQDRAKDFPFYDGEIKKEIDALLTKQPLAFQNDPSSVENVYHTVVGRNMKDINEGKIKSRFASSSSTNNQGPQGGDSDKKTIKSTPEIEKAARLSGLKTEDYIKLLQDDEEFDYVG